MTGAVVWQGPPVNPALLRCAQRLVRPCAAWSRRSLRPILPPWSDRTTPLAARSSPLWRRWPWPFMRSSSARRSFLPGSARPASHRPMAGPSPYAHRKGSRRLPPAIVVGKAGRRTKTALVAAAFCATPQTLPQRGQGTSPRLPHACASRSRLRRPAAIFSPLAPSTVASWPGRRRGCHTPEILNHA